MEIISNKALLCCWREMDQFLSCREEDKGVLDESLCHPNFGNNKSPSHKGLFP